MIYLERPPTPALRRHISTLWYVRTPASPAAPHRVLPNGCAQIILNLAADHLIDADTPAPTRMAAAVLSGARSTYTTINTANFAELAGIVFQPAGFAAFAPGPVDVFSNRHVALENIFGPLAETLRDRLRGQPTPAAALDVLEAGLAALRHPDRPHDRIVHHALRAFARTPSAASVARVAKDVGWSPRHFSQRFRQQVGLTPKLWCRVQRFQRIVRHLHAGADLPWAELALACGYCDQSHFAHDFRAFSGLDATAYLAGQRPWANHVTPA